MNFNNGKERYLLPFFFCWWMFALLSCRQKPVAQQAMDYQAMRTLRYTDTVYPSILHQVQSGDLVLRLGSDMTSELLRQMNNTDKGFSHCGIASIENDTVFVYHAIGGEFNPDQEIKRETLFSFGHSGDNKAIGLYRLNTSAKRTAKVADLAKRLYTMHIPFDMSFNYESEDRLYCAEFVAKTMCRAIGDSSWLSFSKAGQLVYVAIDNLFLNRMLRPIDKKLY